MPESSRAAKAEIEATATQERGGPAAGACTAQRVTDPLALIIFGATGDLTSRKLFPSLYSLFENGLMPESFCIVGVSRTDIGSQEFRSRMRASLSKDTELHHWEAMAERIHYHPVQPDSPDSFRELASFLGELDQKHGAEGNKLFYMAMPPSAYEMVAANLGQAGLSREGESGNGWVRLVVEKPFGRDLETARALDRTLHEHFSEHQIFRIDHYLAKETVQNILMFRFANSIFEPVWNRRYIDHVQIWAAEDIGVGHRAGYFDHFGVLRDMFQNHMMQLLALCAMEPPSKFEADRVRDEKTKVYRSLRPFPVEQLEDFLVLGQYTTGVIGGEKVPGYLDEPNVDPESLTPTFAAMKIFIDNWRWQGVPFYLVSGKRLAAKQTTISVQFKQVPYSMFRGILGEDIAANRLTLGIQPREEVSLSFQTKVPGPGVCLRTVTMHFDYNRGYTGPFLEAYEKVLLDCMAGDQTLFWRQDGVELCWSFLTPILEECDCPERGERLHMYKAGTWGPQQAKALLPPLPREG